MRRLITLASLLVAVPSIALAQDHHGGGHGGPGGPGGGGQMHGGPGGFHGGPGGGRPGGFDHHGGPGGGPAGGFDRHGGPGGDRPGGFDHHGGRGGDRFRGNFDRGRPNRGQGEDHRPHDFGARPHDWPGPGREFDHRRWGGNPGRPDGWRPPHHGWQGGRPPGFRRVHARPFVYPRGYGYRRWSIGLLLPRLFYGSNYYYSGWETLGLYPPPPGDRWVRYGPDLLLVNVYTGRIDDAIYGAFY